MGCDKLMMPWGDELLIDVTLQAWANANIDAVAVIVHPDNAALISHLSNNDVHVVVPDKPPAEMKDSVRLGLEFIEATFQPDGDDRWLLAPADIPGIAPRVIQQTLQAAAENQDVIIVPSHAGKTGHPAAFPWSIAHRVAQLGKDEGVNSLMKLHPALLLECGEAALAGDVDTPGDYARLHNR